MVQWLAGSGAVVVFGLQIQSHHHPSFGDTKSTSEALARPEFQTLLFADLYFTVTQHSACHP